MYQSNHWNKLFSNSLMVSQTALSILSPWSVSHSIWSDIYKMSPDIHQMYQDIHQMYDTFVNKFPIAHLCSDFQTLYQLQFGVHAVCHVLCAMLCSVQRAMCTLCALCTLCTLCTLCALCTLCGVRIAVALPLIPLSPQPLHLSWKVIKNIMTTGMMVILLWMVQSRRHEF